MNRPDFSNYVAHFTKAPQKGFTGKDSAAESQIAAVSGGAIGRLISILTSRTILATNMPWTGLPAVPFTECPWWSLIDHTARYSPYGVGFTKEHLFNSGGAPAIYMRPDHYNKQKYNPGWNPHVDAFVTPYAPKHAFKTAFKNRYAHLNRKGHGTDYSHEREWRVPHNFTFELSAVQFVVVKSHQDVATVVNSIGTGLSQDKFLIMDMYKRIEELWPTHKI
ncbi:terminase [bacterium]|nr:terminase [bacterium]